MVSILVFVAIILALLLMTFNYFKLKKFSEGTYDMADIASIIRNGAKTFMVAEYKTIVIPPTANRFPTPSPRSAPRSSNATRSPSSRTSARRRSPSSRRATR